jgi:hypothetical protein
VALKNSIKVGPFGFLVINVYNHGEHYEMPCTFTIDNIIHFVNDNGIENCFALYSGVTYTDLASTGF